uniref:Uncharacterized protein n=1 Tax=Anguilla anguilla TaxID=7936 RepID=A0A0E9WKF5_ANGAN
MTLNGYFPSSPNCCGKTFSCRAGCAHSLSLVQYKCSVCVD